MKRVIATVATVLAVGGGVALASAGAAAADDTGSVRITQTTDNRDM
ncbi:hypothetical protein OUY22_11405 [Nonomuraea sp. MCN248]|uniref:Uncharacterized protein n=1 Tax=Nonomuraea corallina TaxID=2989783 RepID=A0ABT4SAL2_9ACTN|nr:hypothetical protein [Nonomuraea corallina]MDA0634025.1 hypothetical protein [Nonomuraea corallina]